MSRLRMLLSSGFAFALFIGVSGASRADDAPDDLDSAGVAALVEQLGSQDYSEREQATRKLIRLGAAAISAVEAALEDEDPEIRFRAASIKRQIQPLLKEALIERFIRGEDSGALLPSWERFKSQFGDDAKSRALFAQMYTFGRYRLTLLEDGKMHVPAERVPGEPFVDEDDEDLAEHPQLTRRPKVNNLVQPNKAKNGLPLGWIAARVFIAGEPEAGENLVLQREALAACFEPAWWEARDSEASGELVRQLTARLVPLLANDRPIVLALGARFGIRETLPLAIETIQEEKGKQSYFALFPIAAFGEESQLPLVERLLSDPRPAAASNNDTLEIQIRDAALATILIVNKQPLRDFFPRRKKDLPDDPLEALTVPAAIGFVNEPQRETTFKKWAAATGREVPKVEKRRRDKLDAGDRLNDDEEPAAADPFDPFK